MAGAGPDPLPAPAWLGGAAARAPGLEPDLSARSEQEAEQPLGRGALALFLILALTWALTFALVTGNAFEDFLITFKHSENLVAGEGLVFHPGERVHGFTSPLGTLLPAGLLLVVGGPGYWPSLWAYRLLMIPAWAGAGALLLARVPGAWRRLVFAAGFLLETKGVAFTINGMETALLLLFLALTLRAEERLSSAHEGGAAPGVWPLGLCWAGLLWTRPDGCVYVGALAAGRLVFDPGPAGRRARLLAWSRAGALALALYAPWVVWASAYYGSPIPHTVVAKAARGWRTGPLEVIGLLYQPIYANMGGWPVWSQTLAWLYGGLAVGLWALPGVDRRARAASLSTALLAGYLFYAGAAPWYLPPAALLGWYGLSRALPVAALLATPRRRLAALLGLALLLAHLGLQALAATQALRVRQAEIEEGTRRVVGEWLRAHVAPGERVYVECLGYVGYYSRAKMLDWPGLASPEVVAAHRRLGGGMVPPIYALEPEWLVLRPWEAEATLALPALAARYGVVHEVDASARLARRWVPCGAPYLRFDARFLILRRRDPA